VLVTLVFVLSDNDPVTVAMAFCVPLCCRTQEQSVFITATRIRCGRVAWIIFPLPWSLGKLAGILILAGAKKLLYWHNEQVLDAFDFNDREGIFLHTAIRELNDLSGEEIIAMQVGHDFHGVGMVDIADFEVDVLIYPVHAAHRLSRKDLDL
jgi:hypothetical protein